MPFKSDKQRKKVMSMLNSSSGNNSPVTVKKGFRRIRVTKDTKKEDIAKFLNAKNKVIAKIKNHPGFKKDFSKLNASQKKKVNDSLNKFKKAKNKKELNKALIGMKRVRNILVVSGFSGIALLYGVILTNTPIQSPLGALSISLAFLAIPTGQVFHEIVKKEEKRYKQK